MLAGAALGAAISCIRRGDGLPVGAGVLVGPDLIVTCAHVVAQALGVDAGSRELPRRPVTVDFPLVPGGDRREAEVLVWEPPGPGGAGDIAGLRLLAPPPAGARMARLVMGRELWNHSFRAFGFPARRDDGVWAAGLLRERTAAGWLQVQHVESTGFVIQPGFSGTPVWDDELQGVVGIVVAAEKRAALGTAYVIPSTTLVGSWPALERHALPPCPYRGLSAFREEDAPYFFGREDAVDRLAATVARSPLTTVLGPSGSGKSSLVAAGLLPRVRREPGQEIVWVRPAAGSTPAAACASAFLPLLEPDMTESERLAEVPKLAGVLAGGGLVDVVERVLARTDARRLMLVVDQFEELLAEEPGAAADFVTGLHALATPSRPSRAQIRILLTLRSDFLDQVLRRLGVGELLQDGLVPLGPMRAEDLRRAVEGPMEDIASVTYQPGLVDRILADVGTEPGALPLLEFALTLLWETQSEGQLSHRAYDALGGVAGALATYAERVWIENLAPGRHEAARRLFGRLVRPGPDGRHTRQIVRRRDLPDEQWAVAQQLAMTRLVVSGRTAEGEETAELTHEALITQWKRLRTWVSDDLDFLIWRERLREALNQWRRSGEDTGALLRGTPLREALQWLAARAGDLTGDEQGFIRAGADRQHRALRIRRMTISSLAVLLAGALALSLLFVYQREVAAEQRAAAQAEALAADAERRGWSQPTAANLLSAAAYAAKPTTETYGNLAGRYLETRGLDLILEANLGIDRDEPAVLSGDGRRAMTLGGQGIEIWDMSTRPVARQTVNLGYQPLMAAWNLGGDRLAAAGPQGQVTLWDLPRRTGVGTFTVPLGPRSPRIIGLQFTPDGGLLIRLGGPLLPGHQILVTSDQLSRLRSTTPRPAEIGPDVVGVSAEGALLTTPMKQAGDWQSGIRAGTAVHLLRAPETRDPTISVVGTGRARHRLPMTGDEQLFSRDGRVLVDVSCHDRSARPPGLHAVVWDVTGGRRLRTIASDFDCTERHGALLDAEGRYLLVGTPSVGRIVGSRARTNLTVWDLAGGRIAAVHVMPPRGFWPAESAVVRDGELLVAVAVGGSLALLDIRLDTLESMPHRLTRVVVSPKSGFLASASVPLEGEARTALRLWDRTGRQIINGRRLPPRQGESTAPESMVFTPDERRLVTVEGGRATVWALPGLTPERTLTLPGAAQARGTADPVAVSVDEHGHLLTALGGVLSSWDLLTGTRASPDLSLSGKESAVGAGGGTPANVLVAARPGHGQAAVRAGAGIDLRDTATWQVARRLTPPATSGAMAQLAFDRTGRFLTAADDSGGVVTWDLAETSRRPAEFRVDSAGVLTGRYLVHSTGSRIDFWDVIRRTREQSIPTEASVSGVFPDRSALVVSTGFGEQRLYEQGRYAGLAVLPLDPRTWRAHLCRISGHSTLTRQEQATLPQGIKPPKTCR
ncbi:trypsin-like peptidase domain-containing protein [Actinomadura scrupuli]|uniref:nSTAND1 domain-containing NTPase n=1 Tax=Actinomadura scrupuli TaxID=559629 RepID=UPI003D97E72D